MARKVKDRRVNLSGIELETQYLSLGKDKPQSTPTLTMIGVVSNAGTGANSAGVATGGVAAKVFTVEIAGTTYYIPLYSSNA